MKERQFQLDFSNYKRKPETIVEPPTDKPKTHITHIEPIRDRPEINIEPKPDNAQINIAPAPDEPANITQPVHHKHGRKLKKFIVGTLIVAALAGIGIYKAFHSGNQSEPAKTEQYSQPKLITSGDSSKIIIHPSSSQDTVKVNPGDNIWNLVKKEYNLKSDSAITRKIVEVGKYNLEHNPEQKTAGIDNRSVIDGKVSTKPDGIPFDYVQAGSKVLMPKKTNEVTYLDDKGNFHDKNKLAQNHAQNKNLDSIVKNDSASLKSQSTNIDTVISKAPQKIYFHNELLASIYFSNILNSENMKPVWNNAFNSGYNYEKLNNHENRKDLLGYMVGVYATHKVSDAVKILGMSKYKLYKTLDKAYGKGKVRKRPSRC